MGKFNFKKQDNKSMETKVKCPVCGAEFALPEHEHKVSGVAIGKDSHLGTIILPLADSKKDTKAQQRINAMKVAGIDVSAFFAIKDKDGKETMVGHIVNGVIEIVPDDVEKKIERNGDILSKHLFKQHVLAQLLKWMPDYRWDKEMQKSRPIVDANGEYILDGLSERISRMGYDYTWEMLEDELKRQAAMYRHHDKECLEQDQRWYNKALVITMFDHYTESLNDLLKSARVHKCKGEDYIKYSGAELIMPNKDSKRGYLYVHEIETLKHKVSYYRNKIAKAKGIEQLYKAVCEWNKVRPSLNLSWKENTCDKRTSFCEQCPEWVDAYKGYGGYFAMQNLIRFHECRIAQGSKKLSKGQSLQLLDKWADECVNKKQGYWMIGALKHMLIDNHFDIEAKRAEWAAKYRG